jgi:multidrug efflux pump subunit AcrB
MIRLPKKSRGAMDCPYGAYGPVRTGTRIPLKDLVTVKDTVRDRAIYHKNLMRVSYVLVDVVGILKARYTP